MARQVRVEYEGALCHVMARGNQGQSIVVDDLDRLVWLAEGCEKITWGGQVREKPLHLTPYDYFEQEQAKQKAKSTASQC
jgi:hypothetical protein